MNGEQTPAPESGQAAPESTGTPEFDYKRAYEEIRPEFTRSTQALSEYEQLFEALSDPATQNEALAALGLELAADTGPQAGKPSDDEFVDPLEKEVAEVRSQLDELRQARELEADQEEQDRLVELRDEFIGESISKIEDQMKQKFTDREEEVLGNLSIAMTTEEGLPDVQGAYNRLFGTDGVLEGRRKQWIDSKSAPQAPLGVSVPADKKPGSKRERVAYIDERVRALDQQQ